jgi:hypothetical protein
MAPICALLGCLGVELAAFGVAAGAVAGVAAGAVAGVAEGLGSAAGGAGGAGSAFVSGGASTARTALWQGDERLDMFFCRHCSDSRPPGGTLAQWAS